MFNNNDSNSKNFNPNFNYYHPSPPSTNNIHHQQSPSSIAGIADKRSAAYSDIFGSSSKSITNNHYLNQYQHQHQHQHPSHPNHPHQLQPNSASASASVPSPSSTSNPLNHHNSFNQLHQPHSFNPHQLSIPNHNNLSNPDLINRSNSIASTSSSSSSSTSINHHPHPHHPHPHLIPPHQPVSPIDLSKALSSQFNQLSLNTQLQPHQPYLSPLNLSTDPNQPQNQPAVRQPSNNNAHPHHNHQHLSINSNITPINKSSTSPTNNNNNNPSSSTHPPIDHHHQPTPSSSSPSFIPEPSFQPQLRSRSSVSSDRMSIYRGTQPGTGMAITSDHQSSSKSTPIDHHFQQQQINTNLPPPPPHHLSQFQHQTHPHNPLQPRRSSESVRVMPTQPRAISAAYDRSFSFTNQPPNRPRQLTGPSSSSRPPIVYPALLSKVAEAFGSRIVLSERAKDGLTYNECFDGREAVDKIAYIIKTTDRNLALLLGRALDSQKFFHDVTYDHRLRDSPHELYQFRGRLTGPFSGSPPPPGRAGPSSSQNRNSNRISQLGGLEEEYTATVNEEEEEAEEEVEEKEEEVVLPCGVFTLLTDCYSPTCTRDRLCYSIACPRRLEQQARLNLKPKPGLQRSLSTESLGDLKEPGTLWIHSVPQEVVDSVSDTEKKRQEAINECIYTERDFVRDLEYLRDAWIKPLQTTNIVPEQRRQDFVTQVFWNVLEVLSVNSRLCELLFKRQKSSHIVSRIGDIYLELVPHFSPFVKYGAHQLYGKYEFEKEKSANPAFAKFVDETERLPESRKLELNAYLTKPTTRLARYPLLLEVALKYTPDDHPDKTDIPKAVKMIRELLTKVNIETGKSENRFNLAQLDQQLVFRQGEAVDLRLREEGRELIFKGQLKKRGGSGSDSAELQVFLFDHAVLMVKHKHSSKSDNLKVYRKPIPLELLTITGVLSPEDPSPGNKTTAPKRSLMARTSTGNKSGASTGSGNQNGMILPSHTGSKGGFSMTWNHLGRKGYSIVLWAPTWQARQKWLDKIEARQAEIRERNTIFEMVSLNEGFFVSPNKVNCATPYDNGTRLVFGTDSGVYLGMALDSSRPPVRVIQAMNVTQVDVIEEHGILLVLADRAVMTFWLDSLDPNDAVGAAKRARKISSNASFFKVGDCLGRKLVCIVKSGSVSSTIKTLEPVDHRSHHPNAPSNQIRGRSRNSLRKIIPGNNDALKVYKEFYIPTESSSVHFLKSKLCIGCQKGFEIVDLESLDTQGLLDPADQSLEFIHKRESSVRPISIYRVEGEFLLCYEDFAFYVNKNGWRAKSGWIIQWEGNPSAFALHYPFVLAFEPSFIEVRHVDSGSLVQIIPGPSIRHLFSESPPSTSAPLLAAAARQGNFQNRPLSVASNSRPLSAAGGSNRLPSFRSQIIFGAESKILQLRLKASFNNQQRQPHLSLSSSVSSTYLNHGVLTTPPPYIQQSQQQQQQHPHAHSYPQYPHPHYPSTPLHPHPPPPQPPNHHHQINNLPIHQTHHHHQQQQQQPQNHFQSNSPSTLPFQQQQYYGLRR